MPVFKGIDRGLDGDALKALYDADYKQRIAVVNHAYEIPAWGEVIKYHGANSAQALKGLLDLIEIHDSEIISIMRSDPDEESGIAYQATNAFDDILEPMGLYDRVYYRFREDKMMGSAGGDPDEPGFYSVTNNPADHTIFVRTIDALPYACASFLVGDSRIIDRKDF